MKVEIKAYNETVEKVNEDYKLRWIGFSSGDAVATVTFKDKDKNKWVCDFVSMGEQKAKLEDYTITNIFYSKELKKSFLDLIKDINYEDESDLFETIKDIVNYANKGELCESQLPLLTFLYENSFLNWIDNSWIEPNYKVTNKDGKILIDDYASNFILGEGVYESFTQIRELYTDESYIHEIIETYSYFFEVAA